MKSNWKERGEVPDTDDEDEDDDSQSTWGGEDDIDGAAKELLMLGKETASSIGGESARKPESFSILEQAQRSLDLKARLSAEGSTQRVREESPDTEASKDTLSNADLAAGKDAEEEPKLPTGGPPRQSFSQQRESTPVGEWLEQQQSSQQPDLSQLAHNHNASSLRPPEHIEEEISKSYVRVSSPSPSPSLSSIASSYFAEQELQFAAERAQSPINGTDNILHDAQDTNAEIDLSLIEDEPQYQTAGRRSFRPRKPLQLHPFRIEAERHRNQFKGANLAPLRIAGTQSSEEGRRKATNPQTQDSQGTDFVTEGDSQESQGFTDQKAARVLEELLSSPVRPPRLVLRAVSTHLEVQIPSYSFSSVSGDEGDDNDDDLPEMPGSADGSEDHEARLAMRRRNFKRIQARMKKAEAREKLAARGKQQPATRDVFDVLESPPATSSPAARPSSAHFRAIATPAASVAKTSHQRPPANTLLTPVASSSARQAAPTPIEVYDDEDAPRSSIEPSSGSSPLKQPPPKLRKLLKGVLPASYLHLKNKIDKQRPAPPPARMRESRSISPGRERDLNRKGVALPRTRSRTSSSTPQPGGEAMDWLGPEESDSERVNLSPMRGFVRETNDHSQEQLPSVYSQPEFDFAMEDNDSLIDPMLPSQHNKRRHTQLVPGQRPFKRNKGSTNLFKNMHGGPRYQPRITDVFDDAQPQWQWDEDKEDLPNHSPRATGSPGHPHIQRGIEDVMPQYTEPRENLPPFMRIAARSAGSRAAIGRQGPARKFVRLEDREGTVEAQTVLRQWRGHLPVPRRAPGALRAPRTTPAVPRAPLRDILNRVANISMPTSNQRKSAAQLRTLQTSLQALRKPAGPRQRRITWGSGGSRDRGNIVKVEGRAPVPKRKVVRRRPDMAMPARTAQLEVTQAEYSTRNNQASFGATKRNLDKGFRHQHRGSNGQNNITLQRFLEDSDEENVGGVPTTAAHIAETINRNRQKRQRKRAPKQIDAETARYRQPDNIVASIGPTRTTPVNYFDEELRGLSGPDTVYPIDFDIKPLRADVYFHESTFIGGGKLAKALDLDVISCLTGNHHRTSTYILTGKELHWGTWDEIVSSEIRVCFEWIVQRLDIFANIDDEEMDAEVIKCMLFMVNYFQEAITFPDPNDVRLCIERMATVMHGLTLCLEVFAESDRIEAGDNINNRRILALSTFEVVLIFQILRLAHTQHSSSQDPNVSKLETLLQKAATTSVKLLFLIGLSPLDDLYEDLRQEAFRQGGIREDHGPAQAWVILMHIFAAANIRRVSFWDAVNAHLLTNIQLESNAKVMEKSWRIMFALLPLMEFDKFGILKSRSRYRHTLENWALPQKLIRRVFDFYSPDVKNLASFTAYCNTLFNRCHYLIQAWGWRRYGSILGTLFDFFAKHQFSHIGPYKALSQQPEFLRDLDGALSTFVNKEDQCFTVFLKIVHSATQQMRDNGNTREIRNLVTRLLPNTSLDSDSQEEKELSKESLCNHHDLLFTLFWAAEGELRGKIKVMLDAVERKKKQLEARQWRGIMRRR